MKNKGNIAKYIRLVFYAIFNQKNPYQNVNITNILIIEVHVSDLNS